MSGKRALAFLLVLGLAGVVIAVLLLPGAPPPVVKPPPPPVVKRPAPPLQADAEGIYVPGYAFTVNRFRFTGFSLRPEPYVTFATGSGAEQSLACTEAVIGRDAVHLRCDDPQVGRVTIDGRFLTRLATNRLDVAVLSAVVTVRSGSGEVLYRAQDAFQFHPTDEAR